MDSTKTKTIRAQGFTLLEVITVLAIFGILLGMIMPNYRRHNDSVKQELDKANRVIIEGAAQSFRLDTGIFPASIRDLLEKPAGIKGWQGPYIDFIPSDPWAKSREYRINNKGKVSLY